MGQFGSGRRGGLGAECGLNCWTEDKDGIVRQSENLCLFAQGNARQGCCWWDADVEEGQT
jgi:hypothetical protein